MVSAQDVKIAVIGVGGRTGTMFAFELQKGAKVLGVGREIDKIRKKEVFIERGEQSPQLFKGEVVDEFQFPNHFLPEIVFLTVKNPVYPVVKFYYQKFKERNFLPSTLILSQNGIDAGEEALKALKEVLRERVKEIQIIRLSLFNPVEKKEINGKVYINYFLPIRLSFGVFFGSSETTKLKEVFRKAEIEAEELLPERIRDMEFTKLFSNLIGIPSAIRSLSVKEGFQNKKIFKEEIEALKEYIKVSRALGVRFLNLKKAPIKLFAKLIHYCPVPVLSIFRQQFGNLVEKKRKGKPKGNLDEIDYYNGAVVRLGREAGIATPVNEEILKRAKEVL